MLKLNIKPFMFKYKLLNQPRPDFKLKCFRNPVGPTPSLENYHPSSHTMGKRKKLLSQFGSITKDQKRRFAYLGQELSRLVYKAAFQAKQTKCKILYFKEKKCIRAFLPTNCFRLLNTLSIKRKKTRQKYTVTRIRNRCILTGRRSIIGKLGISRIKMRELAGFGKIPGLVKI